MYHIIFYPILLLNLIQFIYKKAELIAQINVILKFIMEYVKSSVFKAHRIGIGSSPEIKTN